MNIKHNFKTMLVWEEVTEKPFNLETLTDIIKYLYVCYTCYNDEDISLLDFAERLTQNDLDCFLKQLGTDKKKVVK